MKFEEILVLSTAIVGLICLIDIILFRRKRLAYYNSLSARAQKKFRQPLIVEYSRSFFPVLFLVLLLRTFVAEPFKIPSGSMKPNLLEGDFVVVNKFRYGLKLPILGNKLIPIGEPKRGDVIVFRFNRDMDMIKRVIGLPGDKIRYEDKTLYINGEEIKQKYLGKNLDIDLMGNTFLVEHRMEYLDEDFKHEIYKHLGPNYMLFKYSDVKVPKGHYFVMGDNRDNSQDSRVWGFVKEKDIIGKAFATWMSWDPINKDMRWNRIGKVIQ